MNIRKSTYYIGSIVCVSAIMFMFIFKAYEWRKADIAHTTQAYDTELQELEGTIANISQNIATHNQKMKDIQALLNTLKENNKLEYNEKVEEFNTIADEHNALVDSLNDVQNTYLDRMNIRNETVNTINEEWFLLEYIQYLLS